MDPEIFAPRRVLAYLDAMNEYSPLISEFGSAEEEAAYNEWLTKKVAASLADGKPVVPHDEVMAEMQAIIDKAKSRAKEC